MDAAAQHHLYELIFPNGKKYIGICRNLKGRWRAHKYNARHRPIQPVHHAIKKYGPENVTMRLLVVGALEYIRELEAKAIAAFDTRNRVVGYNVSIGGEACPMDTPEVREKMRATKNTPEYRAKASAALRGVPRTPEWLANMSAARKGKKMKPHSYESRLKRHYAGLGRRHPRAVIEKTNRTKALKRYLKQVVKLFIAMPGYAP